MPEPTPDLILAFPGGTATGMASVENCQRLWDFLPYALRCQLAAAHYNHDSFAHALLRAWRAVAQPDGGPVRLEIRPRPVGIYLITHSAERGLPRREVPLLLVDLFLVYGLSARAVRFPGHVGMANVWSLLNEYERAALIRLDVTPADFNRAVVECWLEVATMADESTIPVVRVVADGAGIRVEAGDAKDLTACGGGAHAV